MSDYGFPLTSIDLQHVIKSFIDRTWHTVNQFQENLTGKAWTNAFLKRHPQLTEMFATIIKCCRAVIDKSMVCDYVSNLKGVLKIFHLKTSGILTKLTWQMTQGQKKSFVIKALKKSATFQSLVYLKMNCGSAAREVLSPYVVTSLLNFGLHGHRED